MCLSKMPKMPEPKAPAPPPPPPEKFAEELVTQEDKPLAKLNRGKAFRIDRNTNIPRAKLT